MIKYAPRLLITGTGSGCGKTTVVCSVLQAFRNRGLDTASFKCGPDFIDPMFHEAIIGTPCANLDLFFTGESTVRGLFLKHAAQFNVIEGAMGYYDGLSMGSAEASAWHAGQALTAPAVLIVNAQGMALSTAALIKGFQAMRTPSGIAGVILNRISSGAYLRLKAIVERECGVHVYGYLPAMETCTIKSRHLGLITAQEVKNLQEKMQMLAAQAEKSIELDALIGLMKEQPAAEAEIAVLKKIANVRIAVARDRAFCFYYRDNLETLRELGAELVEFSPLEDARLPACDGLYLGGGYPELYAGQLAKNLSMHESVRMAVQDGLPTVAECGGFMYLTRRIGRHRMTGAIRTGCRNMKKLVRFGYAEFSAKEDSLLFAKGSSVRGHEFHHWDARSPGEALTARKISGESWKCAYATDTLYAGYPHLYFPGCPETAERFIRKCAERKSLHDANGYRKEKL